MPSPTFIGRSAEDLNVGAGAAEAAAAGAGETRDTTTRASQQTLDEINDATSKLQQHFDRVATEFRGQITQFANVVRSSDWEGQAKQSALQLADTFSTRLETLVQNTTEQIQTFKTWMIQSADAFNGEVQGTLGNLLDSFGQRYDGLSRVITDFNTQMEDVETTGSTRFAG